MKYVRQHVYYHRVVTHYRCRLICDANRWLIFVELGLGLYLMLKICLVSAILRQQP